MNFDIGEQEKEICKRLQGIDAGLRKTDRIGPKSGGTEEIRTDIQRCLAELAQIGYLTPGVMDGLNSVPLVLIQEELAALAPSLFLPVEASTRIFGRLLAVYGTSAQREAILPGLLNGRLIGAVALSEQGMNIENEPLSTRGVSAADILRVTGAKGHVMNAGVADWIAVAGHTDDPSNTAFFLVRQGSEGLQIGERLTTLGYEDAVISPVRLEDSPVPFSHVIRPETRDMLQTVRMWEDQVLTAASLGLMRRAFDEALGYAKIHQTGGRPVIAYQEVGFKLAEMLTLLQTSQLLAYRAAWMSESQDREAAALTHCGKVFCAESAEKIASEALQILGGFGYLRGNSAESGYRNAKYIQIAGTSTEISRVKIGDAVLAC